MRRRGWRVAALAVGITLFATASPSSVTNRAAARPLESSFTEGARTASVRAAVASACDTSTRRYGCRLVQQSRHLVAPGISSYSFALRVGPGRHDVIGLHRVVREDTPGEPVPTDDAVMLVHGDVWGFDPLFAGDIGGPVRAPNVATFLARRDVDVWGVDLRWSRVPSRTDDFSFMRSWGPAVDVKDIRVATTVERAIRAETGSGSGQTALLGYSSGGLLAYAYANFETHLPDDSRNVDALVPADTLLRYGPDDDSFRRKQCRSYRSGPAGTGRGHLSTEPEGDREPGPGCSRGSEHAINAHSRLHEPAGSAAGRSPGAEVLQPVVPLQRGSLQQRRRTHGLALHPAGPPVRAVPEGVALESHAGSSSEGPRYGAASPTCSSTTWARWTFLRSTWPQPAASETPADTPPACWAAPTSRSWSFAFIPSGTP